MGFPNMITYPNAFLQYPCIYNLLLFSFYFEQNLAFDQSIASFMKCIGYGAQLASYLNLICVVSFYCFFTTDSYINDKVRASLPIYDVQVRGHFENTTYTLTFQSTARSNARLDRL